MQVEKSLGAVNENLFSDMDRRQQTAGDANGTIGMGLVIFMAMEPGRQGEEDIQKKESRADGAGEF